MLMIFTSLVWGGLTDNAWVRDIAGQLTIDAVVQFFRLWSAVGDV